ncbi:MAG: Coenzyme F420 hydrogenase/dehydrogenase, beta subunit C-terminal domain [Candidatus Omnitrophica bacterium]|nr:Coenzyme F420 hydrogenase/dehydrogenase, beta subunit C-terminal domain [Candidatus Omnitrophota bacterium]
MKVAEKEKCTGCGSCYNVCPVNAISMKEDREGFLRPAIDERLCTNCGLCSKVCPEVSNYEAKGFKKPTVYAAWNLDEAVRINSSSGGIFSVLSDYILEQGGVVFGAAFDEKLKVKHIPVFRKEELYKLRGSKYVQSEINNSFSQVREYLDENKKVLFSGTPCQVAGLLSFLGKDPPNLLTCDFVCHGVLSPKVFVGYLRYLGQENNSKVTKIYFRDKRFGWDNFSVHVTFKNNKEYTVSPRKDKFFRGFAMSVYLRPSCSICRYAKIPRVGDISLGDFWGIGEEQKFTYNTHDGVSMVLINSTKGEDIFDLCRDRCFIKQRELKEAVKNNAHLSLPSKASKYRTIFFSIFNRKGFAAASKKYSGNGIIKRIVTKIVGSKIIKIIEWGRFMLFKKT